jgi:hypothetical protein
VLVICITGAVLFACLVFQMCGPRSYTGPGVLVFVVLGALVTVAAVRVVCALRVCMLGRVLMYFHLN